MKQILTCLSVLAIATADVSHLGGVSNQYLPPAQSQLSPGYVAPSGPQRLGKEYLPPVQSPVFPTAPQTPIFSPSVSQSISSYRPAPVPAPAPAPVPIYRPPTPLFTPNVPTGSYLPPLHTQAQIGPIVAPAPARTPAPVFAPVPAPAPGGSLGGFGGGFGTSGSAGGFASSGSFGQSIFAEPAPAHSFGPDGYSYRRPAGGFAY